LAVILGVLLAGGLFYATATPFTMSGLDLFFFATTVISLGFNLWQLFRDRYKYAPLKNSLLGLFNDLKGRSLRAHGRQILLTSRAGQAATADEVRMEFYDFADEMKLGFEQVRRRAQVHVALRR
jgi:hypothetical protein